MMIRRSGFRRMPAYSTWIVALCGCWLLADVSTAQEAKSTPVPEGTLGPPLRPAGPVAEKLVPPLPPGPNPTQPLLKALDAPASPPVLVPNQPSWTPQVVPVQQVLVEVYALKHANAASVVESLKPIVGQDASVPVRLAVDNRTNAIVVSSPREVHDRIRELINVLDVPQRSGESKQYKVFSLVNVEPAMAAEILSELLGNDEARIAVEARSKSLIVSGPQETLKIVEALLLRLDETADKVPEQPAPSTTFRVRVVWLASGVSPEDAPEPSEDLEKVVAELSKVGIEDVRQIGQIMVNIAAVGSFQASGSPMLGKNATDWRVSGELSNSQGRALLEIELTAIGLVADGKSKTKAELQTTVCAPYGHYVVLGVTPVQSMSSVFVVQIVPNEE
ncbi:MAG: hypothetical protein A2V70_09115 [Planctomycetes bacterium RBG_13_63_9]|nr:MAG: hypothetical protein A2V70_09115 [Planctomycetes bacterium RBG_13_63_9]